MDAFLEVIRKKNYVLQCKLSSYVKYFLDKFTEEGYFVHKVREPTKSSSSAGDASIYSPDSSDCDITGSPLKFTFYNANCDDTTIIQQTDWLADEENHVGLSKQESSTLLSHYFLKMPDGDNKPLWMVCDGLDSQTTLLMAGHKKDGWLARSTVRFSGLLLIDSPELSPRCMKEQHAKIFTGKYNTRSEVFCRYIIFESATIGGNVGLDSSMIESNIKVQVDLHWNLASMKPPSEDVTANLAVQVNVGHYCSEIMPLWQQLCLLQKLIHARLAADVENRQPILPGSHTDETVSIRDQVLRLLHGPSNYKPPWSEVNTKGSQQRGQLKDVALEVAQSSPDNLELTHRLWLLLTDCSDIHELMSCLELIFSEVRSHRARPFVRPSNQSTIAQVILKLMKDESTLIKLTGINALEYLIEIGIDKLNQDYTTIFVKAGLSSMDQLKAGQSDDESLCRLETRLTRLARLHSCLEVLLATQPHLSLPRLTLYSLATHVMENCTEGVHSLEALKKDSLISLSLPVPFNDVKNRLPSYFTRWRLTLRTDCGIRRITSVFLCSASFMFPPSVYTDNCDDSVLEEGKKHYYLFKLSCWNDKMY